MIGGRSGASATVGASTADAGTVGTASAGARNGHTRQPGSTAGARTIRHGADTRMHTHTGQSNPSQIGSGSINTGPIHSHTKKAPRSHHGFTPGHAATPRNAVGTHKSDIAKEGSSQIETAAGQRTPRTRLPTGVRTNAQAGPSFTSWKHTGNTVHHTGNAPDKSAVPLPSGGTVVVATISGKAVSETFVPTTYKRYATLKGTVTTTTLDASGSPIVILIGPGGVAWTPYHPRAGVDLSEPAVLSTNAFADATATRTVTGNTAQTGFGTKRSAPGASLSHGSTIQIATPANTHSAPKAGRTNSADQTGGSPAQTGPASDYEPPAQVTGAPLPTITKYDTSILALTSVNPAITGNTKILTSDDHHPQGFYPFIHGGSRHCLVICPPSIDHGGIILWGMNKPGIYPPNPKGPSPFPGVDPADVPTIAVDDDLTPKEEEDKEDDHSKTQSDEIKTGDGTKTDIKTTAASNAKSSGNAATSHATGGSCRLPPAWAKPTVGSDFDDSTETGALFPKPTNTGKMAGIIAHTGVSTTKFASATSKSNGPSKTPSAPDHRPHKSASLGAHKESSEPALAPTTRSKPIHTALATTTAISPQVGDLECDASYGNDPKEVPFPGDQTQVILDAIQVFCRPDSPVTVQRGDGKEYTKVSHWGVKLEIVMLLAFDERPECANHAPPTITAAVPKGPDFWCWKYLTDITNSCDAQPSQDKEGGSLYVDCAVWQWGSYANNADKRRSLSIRSNYEHGRALLGSRNIFGRAGRKETRRLEPRAKLAKPAQRVPAPRALPVVYSASLDLSKRASGQWNSFKQKAINGWKTWQGVTEDKDDWCQYFDIEYKVTLTEISNVRGTTGKINNEYSLGLGLTNYIQSDIVWKAPDNGGSASFTNLFSATDGVIIAVGNDRRAPSNPDNPTEPVYLTPDNWSEIAWWQWIKACREQVNPTTTDFSGLKFIFQSSVDNQDSAAIMDEAIQSLADNQKYNTKHTFNYDDVDNPGNANAFWSLLGSPNGIGAFYILVDHKEAMQDKRVDEISSYIEQDDFGELMYFMWMTYR